VHVLTKIFIVLVSLLAVMLVPLVVTYAYNENAYQKRFADAEAQADAAQANLSAAAARHGAVETRQTAEIQRLMEVNAGLRRTADDLQADVRQLESELALARNMDTEINAQLSTLAKSVDAGQVLTESLITELRNLRREALASERQKVELDEALRDVSAQLDVAVEARRALQEQLQRLQDEHATALDTIGKYVATVGQLSDEVLLGSAGTRPDRNLSSTIIGVRRSNDQVLAEIDAGERDGVKVGWTMTISHGGKFIATLRIINVDINRATGVVEQEDANTRGVVEIGNRASAHAR
jgi:hypothetical protein